MSTKKTKKQEGIANFNMLLSIFHPLFKKSIRKAIIHNGKLTVCVIPPDIKKGSCERQENRHAPYNKMFINLFSLIKTVVLLLANNFMLVVFVTIRILLLNNSLLS